MKNMNTKESKIFAVAISLNLIGVILMFFSLFNEEYSAGVVQYLAFAVLAISIFLLGISFKAVFNKFKLK